MAFEDRITIATPEGVDLDVTLAGPGSRALAFLIDTLIQWAVLVALILGLAAIGAATDAGDTGDSDVSDGAVLLVLALFAVFAFLLQFGYHVLFESLGSGRSPGKRWTGLRVVREGGRPVGFRASAVRNLLRLVDTLFGIGFVVIVLSRRHQRLGDMVAGTLVVRERRARRAAAGSIPREVPAFASAWDVSGVNADELATVRRFLERRTSLTVEARHRLGWELAQRLRPKIPGCADDLEPEPFLEAVVAVKVARG